MKHFLTFLISISILGVITTLNAQEIIMLSENIKLTKTCEEYIIEYRPQSVIFDTVEQGGQYFYRAGFADMSHVEYTEDVGYPELPIYSITLQVPIIEDEDCEVSVYAYPIYPNNNLGNTDNSIPIPDGLLYYPTQECSYACFAEYNYDFYFNYDTSWMANNYYYDTIPVSFMGFGCITLNILPLHYNPEYNCLRQMPATQFIITPSCGDLCWMEVETPMNPIWGQDAISFFDNYEGDEYNAAEVEINIGDYPDENHSGYETLNTTFKGDYLIIVQDAYEDDMEDFVAHKIKYGYHVTMLTLSEAVLEGTAYANEHNINTSSLSLAEKIRYAIKSKKEEEEYLKYVLLVSQEGVIPSSDEDIDSDIFYAALKSHLLPNLFLLPEVYIGRWIVPSSGYLSNVIEKTIYTETAIRYNYVTLASGDGDGSDNFKKTNSKVADILVDNGVSCNIIVGTNIYAPTQFYNSLMNNSNDMWIYRGHANEYFIGSPYFLEGSNYAFYNNFIPFGFSFSCSNNPYSGYGFGSQIIVETSDFGDATFYGASDDSNRDSNDKLEKSVFKQFDKSLTIGQMVAKGARKYYDACRTSPLKQKQVKLYNLLGDPSLYLSGLISSTGKPRPRIIPLYMPFSEEYLEEKELFNENEVKELEVYNILGILVGRLSPLQIRNLPENQYIVISNTLDGIKTQKIYVNH
ncbi:MAG: hypothetical protein IJ650_01085 [Paludibacteraceae bacterium]|nr:hypothetical protein [Paludibacteraceae bacterium]